MCKLVVACESKFDSDTESLDRHDRYRTNERANGDVHGRVCFAITRDYGVNHDQGEYQDSETI